MCVYTCVHVSMACETLSLHQSGLPGPAANRAHRVAGLLKSPLVCWEGHLPSWGAAGCRWSDIKFYSASHLVAALAGQKNSPWASSGFWTSCSVLTRPSGDPQSGPCLANEEGPPLQPTAAGSALPSPSLLPRAEAKRAQSLASDRPEITSWLYLIFAWTSLSICFLLSELYVQRPLGG